jgi:hypothetical protein
MDNRERLVDKSGLIFQHHCLSEYISQVRLPHGLPQIRSVMGLVASESGAAPAAGCHRRIFSRDRVVGEKHIGER